MVRGKNTEETTNDTNIDLDINSLVNIRAIRSRIRGRIISSTC